MAKLAYYLEDRLEELGRDVFAERMREAGSKSQMAPGRISAWFTGSEKIPKAEIARVLEVLGVPMNDALEHMDSEDADYWAEKLIGRAESRQRYFASLQMTDKELERCLARARERGAKGG